MLTRTVVQRAAPWARLKCVPTHHVLRLRAVQRRLVAGFASDSNPEIGAQAGGEQCSTSAPSDFSADLAYLMAASRLEEVLAEARRANADNEPSSMENYSPMAKLTMCINSGGLVLLLAVVICYVIHEDPRGGMSLSLHTLASSLVGVAWALPVLMCSAAAHTPAATQAVPLLQPLHRSQRDIMRPLLKGLDAPQVSIVMACMVLPQLVMLLPAVHGSVDVLLRFILGVVLQPFGGKVHVMWHYSTNHGLGAVLYALLSSLPAAGLGALVVSRNLRVLDSQLDALTAAVAGSDRYFRHSLAVQFDRAAAAAATAAAGGAAADASAPMVGRGAQQAAAASTALRHVAAAWVMNQQQLAQLAGGLAALNVMAYSCIWQATHDLSTPLVVCLLHLCLESYFACHSDEPHPKVTAGQPSAAGSGR